MIKYLISILFLISGCNQEAFANMMATAVQISTNCSTWTKNLNCSMNNQQLVDNAIDQFNFSGGAVTSVTNADGTLTISPTTGDVVVSRPAITGDVSIPIHSNTATLATVNSNVGSYTNANITVNAKGLITAAGNGSGGGVTSVTNADKSLLISPTTGLVIAGINWPDLTIGNMTGINWQSFYPSSNPNGYLNSINWAGLTIINGTGVNWSSFYPTSNPFNYGSGTVTSVPGTIPIISSGGSNPNISLNWDDSLQLYGNAIGVNWTAMPTVPNLWTLSGSNLYPTTLTNLVGVGINTGLTAQFTANSLGTTINPPTVLTATLTPESLISAPSDSVSLIYGPEDSSGGGSSEDSGGTVYTANCQTINATVYAYKTIGGTNYVSPSGYGLSYTDSICDGVTQFSVSWYWNSSTNGDGSGVSGYIINVPAGSQDNGTSTSYDDNTPPNGASYTGFGGMTASGQSFTFTPYNVALSPSGGTYASVAGTPVSITEGLNNGTQFWVSHTLTGNSGTGFQTVFILDSVAGASTTSATSFYQTSPFGGTGSLPYPQHYGIQSNGSNLNIAFKAYAEQTSPLLFSSANATASTTDANNSNYYSITMGLSTIGGGSTVRYLENLNGGGYSNYHDTSSTIWYYDALDPSWTSGSTVTPNTTPGTAMAAVNNATTYTDAPQFIIKSNQYPTSAEAISFQDNNSDEFLKIGYAAGVDYLESETGGFSLLYSGTDYVDINSGSILLNKNHTNYYDFKILDAAGNTFYEAETTNNNFKFFGGGVGPSHGPGSNGFITLKVPNGMEGFYEELTGSTDTAMSLNDASGNNILTLTRLQLTLGANAGTSGNLNLPEGTSTYAPLNFKSNAGTFPSAALGNMNFNGEYFTGDTNQLSNPTTNLFAMVEGTTPLTQNQLITGDSAGYLTSLATSTYPSLTELSYVKGVTSAIQTQINSKGTGTVTSVASGAGLSGGTITSTGTLSLNLSNAQTWAALQKFTNSDFGLLGSSTGYTLIESALTSTSNNTWTIPITATDTFAGLGTVQTFSANQTISGTDTISGELIKSGSTGLSITDTTAAGHCTSSSSTTCTATVRSGCTPVCSESTSVGVFSRCAVSSTTLTCTFGTSGTNTCNFICF